MARDRDRNKDPGDALSPSTSQSKRSSLAHDSDSLDLDSDSTQQRGQPHNSQHQSHTLHSHPQHQQRKQQKHHVAGGGTRLHARTTSSKGLYKHNAATSATKLQRRLTSPSPDRSTTIATALTPSASSQSQSHSHSHSHSHSNHRRNPSSEARLSRDSSATNLKKNHSHSSLHLKRNKSHVEVNKRTKSAAQLRRSASEKAVHKLKPSQHKSAVHFDLGGTDGQNEDDDDEIVDEGDEWVDASSSASPYLSRRGSVNAGGQQSSALVPGGPKGAVGRQRDGAGTSTEDGVDGSGDGDEEEPTPLADPNRLLFDEASQHSRNLTSRLLQRTPSHSATTSMSKTMAMAKAASPDSKHSASTLSVTPAQPQGMAGSNGTVDVTSRFITSQDSPGSFYAPADGNMADKRPHSMGGLSEPTTTGLSTASTKVPGEDDDDDDDELTDEEDTGITSAIASTARLGDAGRPPAATSTLAVSDKSRTQQKINLQRASSSMEPVRHRHSNIGGFAAEVAEVAGPLLGGAGYETQDPRVNRLLERTGVEYNIVRRYQNPVARSLARLALLPGNDKARRIPKGGATAHPSSRHSVHNFGGLSQSFRETTSTTTANGNGNGTTTAQGQVQGRRPETPMRRAYSSIKHSGAGSSLDTDDDAGKMMAQEQRLSGASLVNGEEDEGIQAILRSLWDKSPVDLAASA